MREQLVLSLFPGIGLLDRAFEEEGFTVVRGPDLLWGGDVHGFHAPAGRFDGIIGGPPCVGESRLARAPHGRVGYTLKHEFDRLIREAAPAWWLMEAVIRHQAPYVLKLSPHWLGEEQRRHRFFHSNVPLEVELSALQHPNPQAPVIGMHGGKNSFIGAVTYSIADMCRLQGLPETFGDELPFTAHGKRKVIGNGVPLSMGRAVARAIKASIESSEIASGPREIFG